MVIFTKGRHRWRDHKKIVVYPWILWCLPFALIDPSFYVRRTIVQRSYGLSGFFGILVVTVVRVLGGNTGWSYIQWLTSGGSENNGEENLMECNHLGPQHHHDIVRNFPHNNNSCAAWIIHTESFHLSSHYVQKRIQNPVKHLRWRSFKHKKRYLRYLTGFWMNLCIPL